jgi:hypothetical protein
VAIKFAAFFDFLELDVVFDFWLPASNQIM